MPTKYLFILGAQRSGSTLLNLILGSHSRAFAIGEGWKLNQAVSDNIACTCGQEFRDCPFWKSVADSMEQEIGWNPFTNPGQRTLHRRDIGKVSSLMLIAAEKVVGRLGSSTASRLTLSMMRRSKTSRSVVETGFSLLDACLKVSERDVAVDSGKDPFRVDAMYRNRPEDCRIIFLVRDGRGVSASRLGKGKSPSKANHSSMKSAAQQWKKENLQTLAVVEAFPEQAWMIQRYEDFCEQPADTLEKMCDFAGLDFESEMVNYTSRPHHNLVGNRMRFTKQHEIALDDAWRRNLSAAEIETFGQVAGDLNRRLGFSPD